jgi:signal transduction histidine kinase
VPWPLRATIALWMTSLVLGALAVVAVVELGGRPDYAALGLAVASSAAPFAAGLLAIRHQPDNWIGTWLTAAGANIMLQMAHGNWQEALAADPGSLPASPLLLVLTQGIWMGWFVPYAMVLVLFPDGRAPGRLGRATAWALCTIPLAFNLLTSVVPGRLMPPLEDWPRPLGTHWIGYGSLVLLPVFLAALVASAVCVVRRHRRSPDHRERAQLRWMLLASASVPATLVLCWIGYLVVRNPAPVVVGLVAMTVTVPLAALVAMLRHDLYDVDRAIVQAGTYTVLALGVVAGWAGVSAFVGIALGEDSVTAAVAATVLVMVLLRPAHAILVRHLGRLLHPREAAGLAAVEALTARVHAGTDQPERLEAVLRDAVRDDGLRVGYHLPGAAAYRDALGRTVDPAGGQPVELMGHEVAVVVPGPGRPPVPARVVRAAGLLADSVRLRGEVAAALADVESSRQRLLRAGDEERRRLERDLHDGAQQRLVSLGMRLRVQQRDAARGNLVDVDDLVDDAVAEISTAVQELRGIAHGLRPSCLDDGLGPALETLTRSSGLPVDVTYRADGLPDHISLTAYYVAAEAVANAVKHSHGTRVSVGVVREPEHVRVAIHDDGRGGAQVRPGSGLAMLRDRVAAVGGRITVRSEPAAGTSIEAVLPCGS